MLLVLLIVTNILLITLHECGHALAMSTFGIQVTELATGIGPIIYSKGIFSFRLFPIGGFVRYAEEELKSIKLWKQCVVYLAGPAVNLIIGIAMLASIAYCFLGCEISQATRYSCQVAKSVAKDTADFAKNTVCFKAQPSEVRGIIGIADIISTQAKHGEWASVAILVATLSLCVGFFQLIPIPCFDGGKIAVSILAAIHPYFASQQFNKICFRLSSVVIVSLIYLTCYHDVSRLFRR